MSEEQTTVVGEQQSEQPQAEAQTTDTEHVSGYITRRY